MHHTPGTIPYGVVMTTAIALTINISSAASGVIAGHGYDNLIEITNNTTRVVLEPNVGGRVLSYQLHGAEIIHQSPDQEGLRTDMDKTVPRLGGGRFDIGPVLALPRHNALWQGPYRGEITGPYSARLTSRIDPDLGIQVIREFVLDPESTHLTCRQIMVNHTDAPIRCNHWSRTFAKGGGIAFAPLPGDGVLPRGYALSGEKRSSFIMAPEPEPNVRMRDNILEFLGEPSSQKSIFNLGEGWLAYLSPDSLLFIKTFPFDRAWKYADPTQHHASFWHLGDEIIEIEPNGPQEIIPPGGQASFVENWWLVNYPMPKDRIVDLGNLRKTINLTTR